MGAGDELVEIVDEDDRVVEVVTRRRMRAENLRHRAVFVAVVASDGRVLIQRRSDKKDVWPGRWDLGAGGVVGVGEPYDLDSSGTRTQRANDSRNRSPRSYRSVHRDRAD